MPVFAWQWINKMATKKLVKKLVCALPNAPFSIDGMAFEPYKYGSIISVEPVDDESAAIKRLSTIRGFDVIEVEIDIKGTNNADDVENNQDTKADKKVKR